MKYKLRMMGIECKGFAYACGGSQPALASAAAPQPQLKKKAGHYEDVPPWPDLHAEGIVKTDHLEDDPSRQSKLNMIRRRIAMLRELDHHNPDPAFLEWADAQIAVAESSCPFVK